MIELEKTSYVMGYTDGMRDCHNCKRVRDYIKDIYSEYQSLIFDWDKCDNKIRFEKIFSQLLAFEELGFTKK